MAKKRGQNGKADKSYIPETKHEFEYSAVSYVYAHDCGEGVSKGDYDRIACAGKAKGEKDIFKRGKLFGGEDGTEDHGGKREINDHLGEFLVEVICHDIQALCGVSHADNNKKRDHLLKYFDNALFHVSSIVQTETRVDWNRSWLRVLLDVGSFVHEQRAL